VPKLAVVEIGDLPAGLLDEITPGVGRILGLDPGPRSRLDPAFAYDERRHQYLAATLLGRLRELTPDDTLVVGAAAVDLFIPILTFVFGEAEMPGRAAVFSIHRLHEEFYGLPPDRSLLAGRAAKEMLHELGHTFGLAHCPDYACAMSSSPSVEAVDLKGKALCNGCLLRRLRAGGASAICRVPPREVWPPFPKV
jgi:archaemetzincin